MRNKYLSPSCWMLLFSILLSLHCSTERTFAGSFSIIHQSFEEITIAASNPVEEEDPALVYEATKLLHATGTPQDIDIPKRFFPIAQIGRAFPGYSNSLSRNEIEEHLVFLAVKVNGVRIPKAHGFPVRVAAEDLLGGKWVKWLDRIVVE